MTHNMGMKQALGNRLIDFAAIHYLQSTGSDLFCFFCGEWLGYPNKERKDYHHPLCLHLEAKREKKKEINE